MEMSKIDQILQTKREAEALTPEKSEETKFYSILVGEGVQEHFLEFRFQDGTRTCFSYSDLLWFNYDPEAKCIDLEFGGFLLTVSGRGLCPRLFEGIRNKRVAWLKESDSVMENHKDNETFIEKITITPPKSFTEEEPTPAE